MKKFILGFLWLLMMQHSFAFHFYDQLCAFNSNWKKYADRVPIEPARFFNNDKDYIQAHLGTVLTILRSNATEHLNTAQCQFRTRLMNILEHYKNAGNFPINYNRAERIPVFVDANNTHCAVGYLLQQTGYEAIALRIAATDNYIWVKDIKDAALLKWQQSSGFSLEELRLIQGAYDHYMPNAFILPNKYVIPQKPACITAYFENTRSGRKQKKSAIWCRGEGISNILNGKWEQNYAVGIPWIIGYFENGKRTGQWMEYYQGTPLLCRTEQWSNDQLNGIRKRFDRTGNLIEEIVFKDGKAVTKTNYDLTNALTWVRTPLDSTLVFTQVYTTTGVLIAKGREAVYNPGNLFWFQNIELTALNSAAITSRQLSTATNNASQLAQSITTSKLYNAPPLVEYKKEGDWIYYKDCLNNLPMVNVHSLREALYTNYRYYGNKLYKSITSFTDVKIITAFDSIKAVYSNDQLHDFYGYSFLDYTHLHLRYHAIEAQNRIPQYLIKGRRMTTPQPLLKELGQYNRNNEKIGIWKHYNKQGLLCKTEDFILPQKEEDEKDVVNFLLASTNFLALLWKVGNK
jgi:hypothetical protein